MDRTIADAFDMWSNHTQLKFTQVTDASKGADILIKFVKGIHEDAYPFDGTGGTLAHAYYPHNNAGKWSTSIFFYYPSRALFTRDD